MISKNFKKLIIAFLILSVIGIAVIYFQLFSSNTKFDEQETFVNIPTNAKYDQVLKILEPFVENMNKFQQVAKLRSYPEHIKSGRFSLKKGMGTFTIVTALRQNIAIKLAFNNQDRIEDLAGRIGSQIEADSLLLLQSFKNSTFLMSNGFNEQNVISIFVPNTYEMYWNTSADKFRDKMLKEYQNFWTSDRINEAKANNLTPIEATTLASIVHKESVKKDERPRIAAVYLNRLKIGMPLQADPTVIYALKRQNNDFKQVIKRVIGADLSLNSPYNTYLNLGLPPGPIAMPDITAIEAVLKPEKNNYLFFCASVEKFGYHEFATTFQEHTVIANKYREWINNQGVKR